MRIIINAAMIQKHADLLGVSPNKVLEKVGISVPTYRNWITIGTQPKISHVLLLSEYFKIDFWDLIIRED